VLDEILQERVSSSRKRVDFPADRECIERIAATVGKLDGAEVTIGWIRNTLALSALALSENLLGKLHRNPQLEVLGEPRELEFDPQGNLVNVLETAGVAAH